MIECDALLLDFGGVISRTLFECHEEMEDHFRLPPGSLRWPGPLDPDADELWRAVLVGEIGDGEYWRRRAAELGRRIGHALEMSDLIAAACGADPNRVIRPEAATAVRKAKAAGRRLGVLSNDLELIYGRETLSRLEILRDMDCLVDGSRSGLRKPSPESYARALDALGSSAQRTLFVDDQPRNVAGATAVGMIGVSFDIRDVAGSFGQVARLLGI